jgi:Peptidase A4 family
MKRQVSFLVAALAAVGVAAAPANAQPLAPADAAVSSNWSGYAISAPGTSFTDVKGSWVQPTATCTGKTATYSSFWIGLGGSNFGAQGLEQAGTSSDCQANGQSVGYAWYELIPAPPVIVPLTVSPGDTITGDVSVIGTTATFLLTNTTTGQTFSAQETVTALDVSSAEWIAEAPAQCSSITAGRCTVLPLANFGTVLFSSASATVNDYTGTISDPTWTFTSIKLGSGPNGSAATPSDLSADGTSFSIAWLATGGFLDKNKTAAKPKVKKAKPKPKQKPKPKPKPKPKASKAA